MLTALNRLRWSCRYYGISVTGLTILARIAAKAGWAWGSSPSFLAFKDRAIDRRFRMSTVGVVRPDNLDVARDQQQHAVQYQPTASLDLAIVLEEMSQRVDLSRFSFVDFGSGKGRVVLLASEFPFRSITGVEFSSALHHDACSNLASFRSRNRRCHAVTSLCQDATGFSIPDGPLVAFFFNPFDDVVMEPVLANLQESWEHAPRDILCIYHNPVHRRLLDESPFWQELSDFPVEHEQWAIYSGAASSRPVDVETSAGSTCARLTETVSV